MGKKAVTTQRQAETGREWVDEQWEQWTQNKGGHVAHNGEEDDQRYGQAEWSHQMKLAELKVQLASLTSDAASSSTAVPAAGAVRPANPASDDAETVKLNALWKEITNVTMVKPGAFEPDQYTSIVAGRPTQVSGTVARQIP